MRNYDTVYFMKIVDRQAGFNLPIQDFGKSAFLDLQRMYGGEVTNQPGIATNNYSRLVAAGGLVIATAGGAEGGSDIYIEFRALERKNQAARWTAMQAYRAKAGQHMSNLMVQVPDLLAAGEYIGRQTELMRGADWIEQFFSTGVDHFVSRSGRLGQEEYTARLAELEAAKEQMLKDFRGRLPSPGSFFVYQEGGDSTMSASGEDLLGTVKVLADSYSEMAYHKDLNSHGTVARTLGASSLDELYSTWEAAMQEPTPLAAGSLVVANLVHI